MRQSHTLCDVCGRELDPRRPPAGLFVRVEATGEARDFCSGTCIAAFFDDGRLPALERFAAGLALDQRGVAADMGAMKTDRWKAPSS